LDDHRDDDDSLYAHAKLADFIGVFIDRIINEGIVKNSQADEDKEGCSAMLMPDSIPLSSINISSAAHKE
jgi:hypothetical protein